MELYRQIIEDSGCLNSLPGTTERNRQSARLAIQMFFYDEDRTLGWSREEVIELVEPFCAESVTRVDSAISDGVLKQSLRTEFGEVVFSRESIIEFMVQRTDLDAARLGEILSEPFVPPDQTQGDSIFTPFLHLPRFLLVEILKLPSDC